VTYGKVTRVIEVASHKFSIFTIGQCPNNYVKPHLEGCVVILHVEPEAVHDLLYWQCICQQNWNCLHDLIRWCWLCPLWQPCM